MKKMLLLFLICASTSVLHAQDTVYHRHALRLPGKTSQAYEREIAQQPGTIHHFVFRVSDTCTVFIVLRSESDSLTIRLNNAVVKKRAKEKSWYVYSAVQPVLPGEHTLAVRTSKPCTYTVWMKQ